MNDTPVIICVIVASLGFLIAVVAMLRAYLKVKAHFVEHRRAVLENMQLSNISAEFKLLYAPTTYPNKVEDKPSKEISNAH